MYSNRNNKKGERNWVKEYNQASHWDRLEMDRKQQLAAEENQRLDRSARERAQEKARARANFQKAYEQASPEDRAKYHRLKRKKVLTQWFVMGSLTLFLYLWKDVAGLVFGFFPLLLVNFFLKWYM